MTINDFLQQDTEWLKGTGPSANIVMSSRTRLARNIDKMPFSNWANKKQLEDVLKMAEAARTQAKPDAARRIADVCLEVAA